MSLDYNLTNVAQSTRDGWTDKSKPEAELDAAWAKAACIIFATIPARLGEITEDNYQEFWLRYCVASAALWGDSKTEHPIDLNDVKSMIGLKTNVLNESREEFLADLSRTMDQALRRMKFNATESTPVSANKVRDCGE